MPFLKSLIDFDIILEIGYAEEQKQPLTLKRLFLMNISSPTTVRRKLAALVEKGVVRRSRQAEDQRSALLTIASPTLKVFAKYGATLALISGGI